jgi:F-type H+-transporting ATPase subunit b
MPAAMTALVAAAIEVGTDVAEAFDAHDAGGGGLPQLHAPDFAPQLFWLAVTFALLYWIMAKIALPRIGERQDRIQRDLAAAERLLVGCQRLLRLALEPLGDARANASSIARQTRESLSAEVEKERKAVEDQLAKKLADAEAAINATKAKALANVKDIASDTAVAIVGALSSVPVSKDEVDRALASTGAEK